MHEEVRFISEDDLCLDLINSEHFDYRGRAGSHDNLEKPEWVAAFVHRWQLPVTSPPDALALALLHALRALLRQMLEVVAAQQPISGTHIEELNAFLALAPLMYQARRTASEVRLQTVMLHAGWAAAVTYIA